MTGQVDKKEGKTKNRWKQLIKKNKKAIKTGSAARENDASEEEEIDVNAFQNEPSLQEFFTNINRQSVTSSMLPKGGRDPSGARTPSFAQQIDQRYKRASSKIVSAIGDESQLDDEFEKYDESAASQPMTLPVTDEVSLNLFKKTMGMGDDVEVGILTSSLAPVGEDVSAKMKRMTVSAGIVNPHDPIPAPRR